MTKYHFMLPKISIITVVRNNADPLKQTLNSLLSLDYANKELIVIDGNSTDSTVSVIAEFAERLSYSISEPDGGIYDAMNKGLRVATGDYVWFMNAGDLPYSTTVLSDIFAHSTAFADIYYGEAMIVSVEGKELGLRRKKTPKTLTAKSFLRGMTICHQSILIKRAIAPMYNLKLRYVADIEWVIQSVMSAKLCKNSGAIISKFSEGGFSTANKWASLKERFGVMRKHYGIVKTIVAHVRFVAEMMTRQKYRAHK